MRYFDVGLIHRSTRDRVAAYDYRRAVMKSQYLLRVAPANANRHQSRKIPSSWRAVAIVAACTALLMTFGCTSKKWQAGLVNPEEHRSSSCPDLSGRYSLVGSRIESVGGRKDSPITAFLLDNLPTDQEEIREAIFEAFADTSHLTLEQIFQLRAQKKLFPAESKVNGAYVDLVRQNDEIYLANVHFSNGSSAGSYRIRFNSVADGNCRDNMYYAHWTNPSTFVPDGLATRNYSAGEGMFYRDSSGELVRLTIHKVRGVSLGVIPGATREVRTEVRFPLK